MSARQYVLLALILLSIVAVPAAAQQLNYDAASVAGSESSACSFAKHEASAGNPGGSPAGSAAGMTSVVGLVGG